MLLPHILHDGRAATLEEIWTKYGKNDKHGLVNDMTKNQLNDLVALFEITAGHRNMKIRI